MIDLKKGFVPRKRKIYLLFREESVFIEEKIYSTIKVTIDCTSIFCRKEEWEEENGIRLLVP